jgi:hypothetical protein
VIRATCIVTSQTHKRVPKIRGGHHQQSLKLDNPSSLRSGRTGIRAHRTRRDHGELRGPPPVGRGTHHGATATSVDSKDHDIHVPGENRGSTNRVRSVCVLLACLEPPSSTVAIRNTVDSLRRMVLWWSFLRSRRERSSREGISTSRRIFCFLAVRVRSRQRAQ